MIRVPDFAVTPGPRPAFRCSIFNKEDALELAQRIRDAWRRSGHEVRVRVVSIPDDQGRRYYYSIKSDLVNGLPRKAVREIRR